MSKARARCLPTMMISLTPRELALLPHLVLELDLQRKVIFPWLNFCLFQPHLTNWIHKEVENALQTHVPPFLEFLRGRREAGEVAIIGGGVEKFKLVFCIQPASTIFTNNEIQAENGEAVGVAIYDATTNAIVRTGPLSSAPVGLVLLDGGYDETNPSLSEFNRNILSSREGKRPLLVGSDIKLNLENGFASIKCVSITDNSSWMKSKKFRLGANIVDENILAMFPTIGAAVSQRFRVLDHRGEGKLCLFNSFALLNE